MTTIPTRAEDMAYGQKNETTTLIILNKVMGQEMYFNGKWDTLDWSNGAKTIYCELKSRRISVSKYPTAILGMNKVNACSDPAKRYIFLYKYDEGLFYIKYRKSLFDTFEKNMEFKRSDRPDASNNTSPVMYIPNRLLKPIANFKMCYINPTPE